MEHPTEASAARTPSAGRRKRAVVSAAPPTQQVRLRWLLSALGLLLVGALCCAYLSLCLLFLQGQWQLLYHPSRAVPSTPASLGLRFTPVEFAPNESGVPQLTGWWLPADPQAESRSAPPGTLHSAPVRAPGLPPRLAPDLAPDLSATTILYLHDASGSLSDALLQIARLHALGTQVFALDYRGFGASAPMHPSEARMVEDAGNAIAYLIDTRHIAPQTLVLWGFGTGATIAAEAVSATPQVGSRSRIVLEQLNRPALQQLLPDPRARLLPIRLLLRDRLDPSTALEASVASKLFLISEASGTDASASRALYARAQGPKCLTTGEWAETPAFAGAAKSGSAAKSRSEIRSFLSGDAVPATTCER